MPNRVSPNQRHFDLITSALQEVNAILAPPISELSAARNYDNSFDGLEGVSFSLLPRDCELGEFIVNMSLVGSLTKFILELAVERCCAEERIARGFFSASPINSRPFFIFSITRISLTKNFASHLCVLIRIFAKSGS